MRAVLSTLGRRAFFLWAWLAATLTAEAATPPTVIVVDSSSSMSAPLNGEVRLDTARAVLGDLLVSWQADAPLGLMAYGHRKAGDCNDIEVLQPIGPVDAAATVSRLTKLRARGKTPLASSIEKAAGLLAEQGQGGTIILVTDGVETCRADPCAVAKALHDAQAGLTIHVVGFAVETKDEEQLACIAAAGGGSYRTAADATALLTGMGEAAGAAVTSTPAEPAPPVPPPPVEAPPPPPVPEPPPPPPPPAPPKAVMVDFEAVIVGEGPLVDDPVSWHISGRDGTDFDYDGSSRGLSLELLPGRYAVDIKASNAAASQLFEVTEAPGQKISVPIAAGRLTSRVVPHKGAESFKSGVVWTLAPLNGQPHAEEPHTANPAWLLAEGQYRLTATVGAQSGSTDITITPGQPQDVEISFRLGTVTLTVATAPDAAPLDSWQGLAWLVRDEAGRTVAEITSEAQPTLNLPSGPYTVSLAIVGTTVNQPVTVEEGKTQTERLIVPTGRRTLVAALGPQAEPLTDWRDSAWTLVPVEALGLEPGKPLAEAVLANNPDYDLLPGRWTISVKSGFAETSTDVTVNPGTTESIRLNLHAGRVRLVAEPPGGQPPPLNIVFELLPLQPDGSLGPALSLGGASRDIEAIVPAGRYRAVGTDEQGRRAEREFELAVGTTQEVSLTLQ